VEETIYFIDNHPRGHRLLPALSACGLLFRRYSSGSAHTMCSLLTIMTLPLLSFDITSTMIKKGVVHFVNKSETLCLYARLIGFLNAFLCALRALCGF
jgi:hypothetical protein